MTMRILLPTLLALALPAMPGRAEMVEASLLKTHVTVVDTANVSNQLVFQGRADGEALTGQLYYGALVWDVAGTIGSDGAVSGNVTIPSTGAALGSFVGDLDSAGNLSGAFTINQTFGDFSAPADQLPIPES